MGSNLVESGGVGAGRKEPHLTRVFNAADESRYHHQQEYL